MSLSDPKIPKLVNQAETESIRNVIQYSGVTMSASICRESLKSAAKDDE